MFGQIGRAISTPKGHTVERTDFAAPLDFSLERVLFNHVGRVTARIAYGRYVRDALKFINDRRIKNVVDAKRGLADYRLLKPWLQDQVNQAKTDTASLSAMNDILKQARINTTLVGLGLRLTTIVKHSGYLANSVKEVGPAHMLKGMTTALAHAGHNSDFVFARSPEMAARAHDWDQNVRDAFSQMSTRYNGGRVHDAYVRSQEFLQRAGFWGMGQFLMHGVGIPTWLGAYHKGLSDGMSEADAALYGDKVMRRTQGTARAMGQSEFQRGSEGLKQLGLFYTYFGTLLNQQREAVRALGRGDWRRAANTAFWMLTAEPLLTSLISGDLPDDDEGWGEWVLDKVFFNLWSIVPVVRNLSSAVERFAEGKATSVKSAISDALEISTLKGFVQLAQVMDDAILKAHGANVSDRWLQHAIETPGYFLGLPTGQPAATIDYLYGVSRGEQHPQGPGDVAKGVFKGRQKEQA